MKQTCKIKWLKASSHEDQIINTTILTHTTDDNFVNYKYIVQFCCLLAQIFAL